MIAGFVGALFAVFAVLLGIATMLTRAKPKAVLGFLEGYLTTSPSSVRTKFLTMALAKWCPLCGEEWRSHAPDSVHSFAVVGECAEASNAVQRLP